jgi:hypothetical protein
MSMDQIHCGMLRLERLCQILYRAVYPFHSVREWWVVTSLANGWAIYLLRITDRSIILLN